MLKEKQSMAQDTYFCPKTARVQECGDETRPILTQPETDAVELSLKCDLRDRTKDERNF